MTCGLNDTKPIFGPTLDDQDTKFHIECSLGSWSLEYQLQQSAEYYEIVSDRKVWAG